MSLDLSALNKALNSMKSSLEDATNQDFIKSLTESQHNLIIAGVIQNFEFTYELCWKFIKRWLTINIGRNDVDGVPRRELYRLAHQNLLIDSIENWMTYHRARNQTSHTYDEGLAEDIFEIAQDFFSKAANLRDTLASKNV